MDELNLIRTLLTEDAPVGAEPQRAARQRLRHAIAETTVAPAGSTPAAIAPAASATARRRAWSMLRWPAVGTGVVAVTAGVALVVGGGGTPSPTPTAPTVAEPGATSTAPQTARQFLLAAAEAAEREPATSGRYWHVQWILDQKDAPSRRLVDIWHATRPSDDTWFGELEYRDGKAAGATTFARQESWGFGAEREISLAELRALPADPTALRARLDRKATSLGSDLNSLNPDGLDGYAFEAIIGLLARSPATPGQRAAGYRLLAGLPNVDVNGTAADGLGRTGTVIRFAGGNRIIEVIIDRDGYEVLSITKQRTIPEVSDGTTHPRVKTAIPSVHLLTWTREWTDQQPVPPTVPVADR
ncbi:CU044_5270 family protein [Plantactinospora sp. GCM10030261]|uniref:CU044_5270 family protein n=1 Tax=Plantactinospora sp. GCM10030261 TaxID=3273420 RepID=UPI0036110012